MNNTTLLQQLAAAAPWYTPTIFDSDKQGNTSHQGRPATSWRTPSYYYTTYNYSEPMHPCDSLAPLEGGLEEICLPLVKEEG